MAEPSSTQATRQRRLPLRIVFLASVSLILTSAAPAEDLWTLGVCAVEPYPAPDDAPRFRLDDREAVDRLAHELRRYVRKDPDAEPDRALLAGLHSGSLRFRVAEVARWHGRRCQPDGTSEAVYMVQVFDRALDREIARAVVTERGLKMVHRSHEHEWLDPLPTLRVPSRLLPVRGAQFVETHGPRLRCRDITPCIAFRSGDDAYLAAHGQLFRLRALPGVSFTKHLGSPAAKASFLTHYEGEPERILTLSGDAVGVAEPLAE